MRYSESKSCRRHNFEAKSKIWQQIFTWKFVYTHWNEDRAWFIFCKWIMQESMQSTRRNAESVSTFYTSLSSLARSAVHSYGDVRAIKDFCSNFGSLWFCHIKNAWVFSSFLPCFSAFLMWQPLRRNLFPKKFFAFLSSEKVFVIVHKNRVVFMVKTMVCVEKKQNFFTNSIDKKWILW